MLRLLVPFVNVGEQSEGSEGQGESRASWRARDWLNRFVSFPLLKQDPPQSFATMLPIGVAAFRALVFANVVSGRGVLCHSDTWLRSTSGMSYSYP